MMCDNDEYINYIILLNYINCDLVELLFNIHFNWFIMHVL